MSTILILCLPDNHYKRFVGKTRTHHVTSDIPLDKDQVEMLRLRPAQALGEPEDSSA